MSAPKNESELLEFAGYMLDDNGNQVRGTAYHGVSLTLSPTYDVHAGDQQIGTVWKDGKRFFGTPAHHEDRLIDAASLEEVVGKLFSAEGI